MVVTSSRLVLPGTTAADAMRLMEDVASSFAQLSHITGNQRLSTTISCGISSFPEYPEAELLTEAADQTLYRAKCQGKGRVEVSGEGDDQSDGSRSSAPVGR